MSSNSAPSGAVGSAPAITESFGKVVVINDTSLPVRVNNAGRFDLPATRVEALYSPEMFGEIPNETVRVKP